MGTPPSTVASSASLFVIGYLYDICEVSRVYFPRRVELTPRPIHDYRGLTLVGNLYTLAFGLASVILAVVVFHARRNVVQVDAYVLKSVPLEIQNDGHLFG